MINIAQKLRPFSHQNGVSCLIPGTTIEARIFPALLQMFDLAQNGKKINEVSIEVVGPVKEFTVMQDLEKGCVTVWCEQWRYHILPSLKIIHAKKSGLEILPFEKLSFGIHKAQEWENIKRRADFQEIFPLWLRLGQITPPTPSPTCRTGVFALIDECKDSISRNRPEEILIPFKKLFLAGFRSLLVPRNFDDEHQAIVQEAPHTHSENPLRLLTEGSKLIRSLFVSQKENEIIILPSVPPQMPAGKFLHIHCGPLGVLHIEWTKKMIRRLMWQSHCQAEVLFHFPSAIKRFRLRTSLKEMGVKVVVGSALKFSSNQNYFFDNFEK